MAIEFNFPYHGISALIPAEQTKRQDSRAIDQRKAFPEITFMVVKEVQARGKFKLETPWGSIVNSVPCLDPNLASYLKEGMSVAVRYSKVDKNNNYIRSMGPSHIAPSGG